MDQGSAPLVAHRATPDGAARAVWRPAVLAAGTGLATFAVGTVAESLIIRAVDGNRSELEWLSDAVISTARAGITYCGFI